MGKASLSNYVEWFELIVGNTTERVREPIGWSEVNIGLVRNESYYGFDLQILGDENITLQFDYNTSGEGCQPGGNILIREYDLHGSEAKVIFRFGYVNEQGVDVEIYRSDIDFNVYKKDWKIVSVGARRVAFNDLFRNRFDTVVNLSDTQDLDGNPVTPKPLIDALMHSKGLFLTSQRETADDWTFNSRDYYSGLVFPFLPIVNTEIDIKNSGLLSLNVEDNFIDTGGPNSADRFRSKTFYMQPAFSNVIVEDLEENQNIPDGIGDVTVNPQFLIQTSGELTVDLGIAWDAQIHLSAQWRSNRADLRIDGCDRGDARMGYARISLKLKIGATVYNIYQIEDNNASCNLRYFNTNRFFAGVRTNNNPVVIENILVKDSDRQTSAAFDNSFIDGFVDSNLNLPPVINPGPVWSTFNVTQNVNQGDEVALWVEMYAEGTYQRNVIQRSDVGWMANGVFWETDRSNPANKSFMNLQLKSFIDDSNTKACMIHEAGASIIELITGEPDRLRSSILGRTDTVPAYPSDGCASLNFITNGFQIRQFDTANRPISTSMGDFMKSINAIYNVGLGIEKDSGDDVVRVESIDYFFNPQPIYTFEVPYEYTEETAQELIFNQVKIGYDKYLDEGINLLDEFNTQHDYAAPIQKSKGSKEIISIYSGSGYMIEVQRREQFNSSPSDSVENDDTVFIVNAVRDGGGFRSRKDEGFTSVLNVFSPETSYNLSISPKRMLYRWASWLKGIAGLKNQSTSYFRFLFGIQNKDLETESNDPCEQPGVIIEGENVALENFPDNTPGIYYPIWINFKHRLAWSDFEEFILNKLQGAGGGNDDYGFFIVRNPTTGNYIECWPYDVQYNNTKQEVSVKALKKN